VETSINGAFVWDPTTLSATSEHAKNEALIDEHDLWLTHLQSPSEEERFKGALTINLRTASVRDMDDGATVASVLAELRRLQIAADLANELTVQNERLEANALSAAEKIRSLEAQLAQQSTKNSPTSSNEQHNENAQTDAGGGFTGDGS
jgi:paraquat-inducible protein B